MGFYEEISRYYDDIFPLPRSTLEFFCHIFASHGVKKVLDVACGSGSLIDALSKKGFEAAGIDLDSKMVDLARQKAEKSSRPFSVYQGDMRDLNSMIHSKVDAIVCMGNSLVHLTKIDEIESTLKSFHHLLSPRGILIIQIINYDRILQRNLKGLPTIHKEKIGLTFERNYDYRPHEGLIYFNTRLTTADGVFENSVPLYPLKQKVLYQMIEKAGFPIQHYYGGFDSSPWTEDSYACVVVAEKA